MITVDINNNGDFTSIQEAINSLKDTSKGVTIFIKNGVYKERVEILKDNVSLIGESRDGVIITESSRFLPPWAKQFLLQGARLFDGRLLRSPSLGGEDPVRQIQDLDRRPRPSRRGERGQWLLRDRSKRRSSFPDRRSGNRLRP